MPRPKELADTGLPRPALIIRLHLSHRHGEPNSPANDQPHVGKRQPDRSEHAIAQRWPGEG